MKRRTTAGTLSAAAAAFSLASAAPASADPMPLRYVVDLTTTVKRVGLTTAFPPGTFTGSVEDLKITGDLTVPTAVTRMDIGSLRLAKVWIRIIPNGPATCTLTIEAPLLKATSTQTFDIQLARVEALGLPVNLVGRYCKTATPVTQVLTGYIDPWRTGPGSMDDYTLTGTYTIPRFQNCGLLGTEVVNATIPGAGNTASAHFHK